jgi:HEAT repeat protein
MSHLRWLAALALGAAVLLGGSANAQKEPDRVLGKTAEDWLKILKEHKETRFRRAALIALEVFGPRSTGVLPAITEALEKDADPEVRREAAMLLGRMGPDAKGAVSVLGDVLLNDKSDKVREAAAQALAGKLNPFADEQTRALTEALSDKDAGTRAAAAEALLKMGEKSAPAYARLLELARDKNRDRFSRQYAIKIISRVGADRGDALEALTAILADVKEVVSLREDAADGLGRLTVAAEKVIPPLVDRLGDATVQVRRAAAAALAKQGKETMSAWPKIKESLKDRDQAVRYQLIRVTGQLAREEAEPINVLVQLAKKDANVENRLAALQELDQLQPFAIADHAEEIRDLAENDANLAVRSAAEGVLKRISGM